MKNERTAGRFLDELSRFQPGFDQLPRILALYSAAIAVGDESFIKETAFRANQSGAGVEAIYEIMLQSYLFLGFPRMLTAAECFREAFPEFAKLLQVKEAPLSQVEEWRKRGTTLCQKVYAGNFGKLKARVCHFSPEIFQFMILEGYGKVLSRPGLDIRDRELAIVACLMVDNRPKQLFSHIRGALNVGVSEKTLEAVINDVGLVTDADSQSALSFLKRLKANA